MRSCRLSCEQGRGGVGRERSVSSLLRPLDGGPQRALDGPAGWGGGAGAGAPTEQSTTASGPLLPALGMSRFFYPQVLPPDSLIQVHFQFPARE